MFRWQANSACICLEITQSRLVVKHQQCEGSTVLCSLDSSARSVETAESACSTATVAGAFLLRMLAFADSPRCIDSVGPTHIAISFPLHAIPAAGMYACFAAVFRFFAGAVWTMHHVLVVLLSCVLVELCIPTACADASIRVSLEAEKNSVLR